MGAERAALLVEEVVEMYDRVAKRDPLDEYPWRILSRCYPHTCTQ